MIGPFSVGERHGLDDRPDAKLYGDLEPAVPVQDQAERIFHSVRETLIEPLMARGEGAAKRR